MRTWLRDFGFPFMVLLDLVGSACLAASARIPTPIPDFALQATSVYRLEIGAACFVVVYLAAIAFFLALDGRGFAELGPRGLRATEVVQAAGGEMKLIRDMREDLTDFEASLSSAIEDLKAESQRLQTLEEERLYLGMSEKNLRKGLSPELERFISPEHKREKEERDREWEETAQKVERHIENARRLLPRRWR